MAKTCLTDIYCEILKFIATEQLISFNEENFNAEVRSKILPKLKEPSKQQLNELNQALNTKVNFRNLNWLIFEIIFILIKKTSSEIIELAEKVAGDLLEISHKKADTKREK